MSDITYVYEDGAEITVCKIHKKERYDRCFLDFIIYNNEERIKAKLKKKKNQL